MSEPVEAERASRIALGVALLWLAAALYVSLANPILGMSDMFGFIRCSERLSLHELSVWVDGFYPALLRAQSALSGDYAISGRLLSLASGALVLASVYGIAARGIRCAQRGGHPRSHLRASERAALVEPRSRASSTRSSRPSPRCRGVSGSS